MKNASNTSKNTMSKAKLFLDSSALMAGVISSAGAARVLLVMSETGKVTLLVNEHVIAETERSLAKKASHALPEFRRTLINADLKILPNPSAKEVQENLYLIADKDDVPILLSAMKAKVDLLVTHNRKHFLDDPKVVELSGLRIGTPGDALVWVRESLAGEKQ
jgi:predicted nucleic acid-binding protein